jgi:hypothetical protein
MRVAFGSVGEWTASDATTAWANHDVAGACHGTRTARCRASGRVEVGVVRQDTVDWARFRVAALLLVEEWACETTVLSVLDN